MKVIFILSDALRYDYIQYMSFLNSMKDNSYYIKKIRPGIGFCEISEYISGLPALENGNIFQLTFNGNYEKINGKIFTDMLSFLLKIPFVSKIITKLVNIYLMITKNKLPNPDILQVRYNIPINMLKYFMPTESVYNYDDDKFFNGKNLFSIFRNKSITYDVSDFVKHNKISGTDIDRLDRLQDKINNKSLKDFTLLYIGYGELAHYEGTSSFSFHQKLIIYDNRLRTLYDSFILNYGEDAYFAILGDHGMVDVKYYIDIEKIIKNIMLKKRWYFGKDVVYFIDSTCIRLWINHNELIIKEIGEEISYSIENAIDHIVLPDTVYKKYGDIILMLKPGYIFFPDFFNKKHNKGMHGYNTIIDEQQGFFLLMGKSLCENYQEQRELYHIHDIILTLMKCYNNNDK
jgi:hypothetical protein